MQKTIEDFYIELGYKTQNKLNKVRGLKAVAMTWEEFSKMPEFEKVMAQRKVSKPEMEAFRFGFERARKSSDSTYSSAPQMKG